MRGFLTSIVLCSSVFHAAIAVEPVVMQSRAAEDVLRESRVRLLEEKQRALLARAQGGKTQGANERVSLPADATPPERGLDLKAASDIARQESVVHKALRDYTTYPRKAFISPRTKDHRLAVYAEDWRQRVEAAGNQNFPRDEQGALYGSVMVVVEINSDGSLASAEVQRPSANPRLDEAALQIVKLAAPFAPMSAALRKDYELLVIARTLTFKRDNSLAPSVQ